jgi:dihydrofolate synthase/folylpolyglutamate synthase
MSYLEVINYLDSFINYEKKLEFTYKESLKLERIRDFLTILENPQDSFKSIHVAGTKGKGSVCAFTAYILKEAGYKTGLYTSPHLTDVRERVRILDPRQKGSDISSGYDFEGMIQPDELVALVERLKPQIDDYCRISKYGPLSFFEVYTALSFVYFREQRVDFAVLETGLGGRLDATNVVTPAVCAITSISYDHTNKLGNSLTEIAGEKAGIIKNKKLIVVSAPQEKEAATVIRERCRQEDAILFEMGKEIAFERISSSLTQQAFNISGNLCRYGDLKIRLAGGHQVINAVVAAGIIAGLNKCLKARIKEETIKGGLYNTFWPARFEVVSDLPLIILDGAHNGASAKALKETIREHFHDKKTIMVLGASADKDLTGICKELVPESDLVILTRADNPRALKPEEILPSVLVYKSKDLVSITRDVQESLLLAKKMTDDNTVIIIAGSLFVVGEARDIILHDRKHSPANA